MKYLVVEFTDKKRYAIPAEFIANQRAKTIAKLDSDRGWGRYDAVYNEEIDFGTEDESVLIEYASFNMDWESVKDQAILLESNAEPPDYDKEWPDAKMEIIEID